MAALSQDGYVAPLRVAVAGSGFASGMHLAGWRRLRDVEVVAICDPDIAKARARADEFGIGRVFDNGEAMLAAVQPDALDIAAPVAAHVSLCEQAAARGVHILCQKPLAFTLAEAERLAESVGDRVRLMVHENWRFRAQYRQIRCWIDEGLIGQPVSCMMQVRSSGLLRDAGGSIPQLQRQPGFSQIRRLMIGEVLIHHLDVLRWLLGPLRVVAARTLRQSRFVSGEDAALIVLEGLGFWATLEGNFCVPGAPPMSVDRLELTGTQGVLSLDGNTAQITGRNPRCTKFDLVTGYGDSYAAAIAHFADSLRARTPFETDLRDNLQTLALVEQSYAKASEPR